MTATQTKEENMFDCYDETESLIAVAQKTVNMFRSQCLFIIM